MVPGRQSTRKEVDRVRAFVTTAVRNSALTREDLLKRGAAAAFAVGMFGALPERALGVYGPLRFQHKQLSGELKILQWSHFVPPYDPWLDGTYASSGAKRTTSR